MTKSDPIHSAYQQGSRRLETENGRCALKLYGDLYTSDGSRIRHPDKSASPGAKGALTLNRAASETSIQTMNEVYINLMELAN